MGECFHIGNFECILYTYSIVFKQTDSLCFTHNVIRDIFKFLERYHITTYAKYLDAYEKNGDTLYTDGDYHIAIVEDGYNNSMDNLFPDGDNHVAIVDEKDESDDESSYVVTVWSEKIINLEGIDELINPWEIDIFEM